MRELEKHQKFLKNRFNISTKKKNKIKGNIDNFPDLTIAPIKATLSNSIPSNGFKKSIDDYKWKRNLNNETAETIAETEKKKKRIAPLWNKGSIMYITDDTSLETLGKKI